jgi:hypothetical protein
MYSPLIGGYERELPRPLFFFFFFFPRRLPTAREKMESPSASRVLPVPSVVSRAQITGDLNKRPSRLVDGGIHEEKGAVERFSMMALLQRTTRMWGGKNSPLS